MQKSQLLSLCLIFLFSLSAHGQQNISVNAGLNLSHAELKGFGDISTSVLYWYAGVNTTFQINQPWSITTDIDYMQKGYKIIDAASKLRHHSIDISPQVQYHFSDQTALSIGPYVGFALKESIQYSTGTWEDISDINSINNVDFGLAFNIRYAINNFYLRASVSRGLIDIANSVFTDQNGNPIGSADQKNMDVSVGFGYYLYTKKEEEN